MKFARANCVSSFIGRQSRSTWKNRQLKDQRLRARRTLHWARDSIASRSRRLLLQFSRVQKLPLHPSRTDVRSASRMNEQLRPLVEKISARLAVQPEIFSIHPGGLRLVHFVSDAH